MLSRKATQLGPHKVLLIGPPGTGKTSLANFFAAQLTTHETQIERITGKSLSTERVRDWECSAAYRPISGNYAVKIINKAEGIAAGPADCMEGFLDDLPAHIAVIITANGTLSGLAEPLQTRLQHLPVTGPSPAEVSALLHTFGLNGQGDRIAQGCNGNVRAALLDAQSIIDLQAV